MDTVNAVTLSTLQAAMKARIPAMLVGPPGTGKTAVIRHLCAKMRYDLITIIGSQMEPTDVAGLPKGELMGEAEDGTPIWGTVNLSPWWQVEILRRKRIVLFLDEFSNTSGATRASLLTMLQNREFPNGQKMPKETIMVGAMNPTEQAADGYELDKPTTNRIMFLPWKTSADSWFTGMLKAWDQEASPAEMFWRTRVVAFLKENPTWIHRENDENQLGDAFGINVKDYSEMAVFRYAWASRRSWDNLTKVLAEASDEPVVQDTVAQGLVGYGAAAAFRDWLLRNSTVDPFAVLANPTSVDWKTMSVNDSNLVLRALVDGIQDDDFIRLGKVFLAIADAGRESLAGAYVKDYLRRVANRRGKPDYEEWRAMAAKVLTAYKKISSQST